VLRSFYSKCRPVCWVKIQVLLPKQGESKSNYMLGYASHHLILHKKFQTLKERCQKANPKNQDKNMSLEIILKNMNIYFPSERRQRTSLIRIFIFQALYFWYESEAHQRISPIKDLISYLIPIFFFLTQLNTYIFCMKTVWFVFSQHRPL